MKCAAYLKTHTHTHTNTRGEADRACSDEENLVDSLLPSQARLPFLLFYDSCLVTTRVIFCVVLFFCQFTLPSLPTHISSLSHFSPRVAPCPAPQSSPSTSSLSHRLIRLLSLLPSRHLSPHSMRAAIAAWTWLAAALPHAAAVAADAGAAAGSDSRSSSPSLPSSSLGTSAGISRASVWGPVAGLWVEQVASGVGLFRGQEGVEEGPRACVSPSIVAGSSVMEREEGVRGMAGEGEGVAHAHGHQHVEEREGRRAVEALQAHAAFVSYLDELVEVRRGGRGRGTDRVWREERSQSSRGLDS